MVQRASFLVLMAVIAWAFSMSQALARTEIIYSTGYSYGFCNGSTAYFCIRDLKDRAKEDAQRDAEFQCWARNGKLENNPFPYCMDYCNPSYLNFDAPNTYVSCRQNCQIDCLIPETHPPANQDKQE